jgi:hypothetical protein
MHSALLLLAFWALAFVTLCCALVLLNIFDGVIGNDLTLHSARKEAAIAVFASLIEGLGFWAFAVFIPPASRGLASRALIVPFIIVFFIYLVAHLEDWNKGDGLMLMVFQIVTGLVAATLLTGHILPALFLLLVFGGILALIASFARSL